MSVQIPTISVKHINPFVSACVETFYLMANVKVVPGKPVPVDKNQSRYDITGIIGISGQAKFKTDWPLRQ